MMKKIILLMTVCLSLSSLAYAKPAPLPSATNVDVARYIGKWYTIASLPQFFTRNCVGQTAEYGILNEGAISVHNVCYKKDGKTKDINGKGVIQDAPNNSHLIVTFDTFWTRLFKVKGDYVIIKLSDGYDHVMVGSNDRKSLWIMSRTPSIDPQALIDYKTLAHELGFSVEQLRNSKY